MFIFFKFNFFLFSYLKIIMPPRKSTRRPRRRNAKKNRRPARRVRRAAYKGYFRISRLVAAFGITKGITSGLITSGNTNILVFGTPVLSVNGITGFYDVPFSFQFQLSDLQGYTDISNICDRYKIHNASIKIHGGNTAAAVGSNMPWIEYICDSDDAQTPTIAAIREKMGVRSKGFNQQGSVSLYVPKLKVSDTVYNGSLSSAYVVPNRSEWINSSYPSVPHFGLKGVLRAVYLDGSNNGNQMIVDVRLSVSAADLQ